MPQTKIQEPPCASAFAAEPERAQATRSRLVAFGLFAALLVAAFSSALWRFIQFAIASDRNGYLLLVPVVSAYLIRTKRITVARAYKPSIAPAAVAAMPATARRAN